MKDYVKRIEDDLAALQEKQAKLNKFFDTEIYNGLSDQKKNLLQAQFGAMLAYSSILIEILRVGESED